jgi:dihydrofolate synthase/folylpolyglutamate synthase
VGFYSSPHLIRFTERFQINHEEISKEKTVSLIRRLRTAFAEEEPPTFFEATTAMALVYFAQENTDISIIEVGMGGRLDATNVITPLITVLTNISLEHRQYLGSGLLDIAVEKAGIIKEAVDVITGATQPAVLDLFQSIAREKKATLIRVGKDVRYRTLNSALNYYGLKRKLRGLRLALRGKFQSRNATMALAALERLEEKGFEISPNHLQEGLKNARWPGRMHVMATQPTILLDGAHNPGAIRALAASIPELFKYRRMILVIGIMEDKEIDLILRGIVPMSDYVFYTRPAYPRAASPEELMARGVPLGTPGEIVPTLTQAIDRAIKMGSPEDLIVVSGSLFTVGEAMAYIDPETYKPDGT